MDRRKVLVVEDEISFRLFLKTLLETNGLEPMLARNGEEGFRKAAELPPDLVILDVMMPRQGGVAMYRQLKADVRLRDIPVIMFSAVPGGTFGHALQMLGVAGEDLPEPFAYVEKPPRPEEMLRIVLSALATSDPRRNANAQEETPHGV